MVQLRDAKTGKPCFGSHFRSFMAPKMGRASVPAESVGVGYVPPHRFHEREDRASLSWLSPRPTLHRPPVCGCRVCSATSFSREGGPRLPLVALPAPDTSQTSCLWVSGMFRHIRVAVFDSKRDSLFFRRVS